MIHRISFNFSLLCEDTTIHTVSYYRLCNAKIPIPELESLVWVSYGYQGSQGYYWDRVVPADMRSTGKLTLLVCS